MLDIFYIYRVYLSIFISYVINVEKPILNIFLLHLFSFFSKQDADVFINKKNFVFVHQPLTHRSWDEMLQPEKVLKFST